MLTQDKLVKAYKTSTILKLLSLEHRFTESSKNSSKGPKSSPKTDTATFYQHITTQKRFKRLHVYPKIKFALNSLIKEDYEEIININSLVLLERLLNQANPSLREGDVLNLYIICYFLSFKFFIEDTIFPVEELAKLSGIDQDTLLLLELDVLESLDFRLKAENFELKNMDEELAKIYQIYLEIEKCEKK